MSSMYAFPQNSSDESSDGGGDHDEENANYNPRKRRRTGRDAKESAAMGIFGSESEDEGPAKKWKKKDLRGRGTAFVGAGQKVEGAEDEDDDEDEPDDNGDIEMEDEEEPAFVGFQAQKSIDTKDRDNGQKKPTGLRFQAQTFTKTTSSNQGTPLGKGFVPSSAAVPVLADEYNNEESTPRIARPSAFSTPVTGRGGKQSQAAPSANPLSFAARMMQKMGYKEGEGLGKEGQGRSGVIEVTLRPQGVGLGAVNEKSKQEKEEEKRQAKIKGVVLEDSDEERRKKKARKPRSNALDSGTSTPKRKPKPKYQTIADAEKAAPGLKIPEAFAEILDMRGPSQRLLTSASGLMTPTTAEPTSESVQQTESRKLARRAQSDMSAFVEEWKNLQERKAYIELQLQEERQQVEEIEPDLEQVRAFAEMVNTTLSVQDQQWDPVLEALISADKFAISHQRELLSDIAVAAVHPFLRRFTEGWQALEDRNLGGRVPELYRIRHILGATAAAPVSHGELVNGSRVRVKSTTPYESMIYKIVFPKIASAITQSWDVHDPNPAIALLEAWEGLLPDFVRSQILEQAVVGKLNEAVSSWKPRKSRSRELPHLWLFPWLQYLQGHHADPKSSTGLVTDVKRKFRKLIDDWDFHKGVIKGLDKWRDVLQPGPEVDHWQPLLMHHIIPSMSRFIANEKNFTVAPEDQEPYMQALRGVFEWQDILTPRIVGQIIVEKVFPQWHSVLHQWLTGESRNYEEIGQWFQWWSDDVFPETIKTLKSVQQQFAKGHDMINEALDLGSKAATHLPAPIQPSRSTKAPSPISAPVTPARTPIIEELSFRHQVEDWCIENDVQFLPEKKQLHSQGPLYRITAANNGKNGTLVYFKGDKLYAVQKAVDYPIEWEKDESKDALLGMAHANVK